jgi:lipoxygenase
MQMPFCWHRSPVQPPENHIAINGTVVVSCHFGLVVPGKTTTLRLFSSTQIDHSTLSSCFLPPAMNIQCQACL